MDKHTIRHLCLFSLLLLGASVCRAQGKLQMWFDDGHYHRNVDIHYATVTVRANLDLNVLSDGMHTLSMRVCSDNGQYSPVYTSRFLKSTPIGVQTLEYWIDGNYRLRKAVPATSDENGVVELDHLDLSDNTTCTPGMHVLYMRLIGSNGQYSPVYTSRFLKTSVGKKAQLCYWLDDDYDSRKMLNGVEKNGSIFFVKNLDFSKTAPGMHRLNLRVVAEGDEMGVIYHEHILVSKLYNPTEKAVIDGYSHWSDDAINSCVALPSGQSSTYTDIITLKPEDYTSGRHVFYVQYRNSAGVWSAPNATYIVKANGSQKLRHDTTTGIDAPTGQAEIFCTACDGKILVDGILPQGSSACRIELYETTGRRLHTQTQEAAETLHAEIDATPFAHQVVIVRVTTGPDTHVQKLVLN